MPIVVSCPNCDKPLRAPDSLAGKKARCPACKTAVLVAPPSGAAAPAIGAAAKPTAPAADEDDFEYKLAPPDPPSPVGRELILPSIASIDIVAKPSKSSGRRAATPTKTAAELGREAYLLQQGLERRSARRFLYFIFLVTLIPLAISMASKDDTPQRVARTLSAHPELEAAEIDSEEALFRLLPDQRFEDAHLSYFTNAHWLYALISAGGFFGLMLLCFEIGRAKTWQLGVVALATATAGILFLIVVQWIAAFTDGRFLASRNIIIMVVFYIAKFIGFSYSAAIDPAYGFWMSFFGFTFGVGLCEELTKALPILIIARTDADLDWRGAAVWGLASGVGFGVAEGILYSSDYYNGVATGQIYVVRFVSCVALHAMWAAAVGIMIARCRDEMQSDWEWSDLAIAVLKVQAVPMILHGLYDVMLKKEMDLPALGVAVLSFLWLAFLIEWCRREEATMMARNAARWAGRSAT
jgi:RsiW-degrading membrane proteinase PrsW (M82 family)